MTAPRLLAAPLRRPARFLIPLLVAGVGAAWLARSLPPRYRATAIVQAEPEPAAAVSLEQEILGRPRLEQLLGRVDPYPGLDDRARIEALLRDLSVRAQARSTFALDYLHADPQQAADVVNRFAGLLAGSDRPQPASDKAPRDPLDDQLAQTRRELEDKEGGLRSYREGRLGTLPEQREALVATLARLREERRELQATLLALRNRLNASEGSERGGSRPELRSPSAELGRLRAELARLRTRYTDLHPDVQRLQSRIARLEQQESAAGGPGTTDALADARVQAATLEDRQQDLDQRVVAFEARVEETSRTEQHLQTLNRDLESLKKRHLDLINQKMSARLVATGEPARPVTFRIVRAAQRPKQPISPNPGRLPWAGLALGLLAGLLWSAVAERRQPETPSPGAFAAPERGTLTGVVSSLARAAREPATDPSEPQAQALAKSEETLVIPAGPRGAGATSALEDLLEPGTIVLRPARPARVSRTSAEEAVAIPRPDPEAQAPDELELGLLDPGSIFWAPVQRSITDTQPVPILRPAPEEPMIREEEQETAPPESAATIALPLPEPLPLSAVIPAVAPLPAVAVSPSVVASPEPLAVPPVHGPEPAGDRGVPALVVAGGPADGTILPLPPSPSERLLGAAAYCHLRVDLPNVDPVHARIASDTFGLGLSDAGSSNGTYVNGRRIAGKYPLKDGDLVFLGPPGSPQSVGLLVHLPPPAARTHAATTATPIRREPAAPSMATRPLATSAQALEALALIPPPPPRAAAQPVLRRRVEAAAPAPSRGPAPSGRRSRSSLAIAGAVAVVAAGGLVASGLVARSAPLVLRVTPAKARLGQTIMLDGSGFEPAPEANTVRLGDLALAVVSASEARLEIALPREVAWGLPVELPLVVETLGRISEATPLTVVAAPSIERLEPPAARAGDVVTAFGRHLDGRSATVHVAGAAAEVLASEPTALRFRVPATAALADGSRAPVDVFAGGEQAERVFLAVGRLPLVTDVVPPRANVGEQVTLRGFGFDPDPAGNRVHFGEREALVLAATATELVVSAPAAESVLASQSELEVLVQARGATSTSPAVFTLLGPPSGTFLPHFYAAPVPELPAQNHAFVATELGPLMLLTGPAGSISTAARAAHAAGVLNELVEAAAKPLALAFKVEPAPSVMLAGGSYIVATATSTDALGYEGLWARLGRRGEATPNSVATHWTALLQDYLALFVQHQRPTKVLELTSRGQLLADIHALALKAAGGPKGVPTELLSRLRPQLAEGLREMALLLSPPGQSNPGAAVVGRWRGTMEEGDRGAQPIQVRLHFEGKRLSGSLTRRSPRGVEGEIRLRSVDYEGGDLSFAVPVGESILHFQGTVRDDAMAGLIRGGESRQAMGFFTLSFVE